MPAQIYSEPERLVQLEKRLSYDVQSALGITCKVKLVGPKEITRSEGKAVRADRKTGDPLNPRIDASHHKVSIAHLKGMRLAMKFETMFFEKEGRIGHLTLNRPQLLNAMNYQSTLDLNRAAEMIRDEPDVRLVLIKGSGRAFCTGIDLKQLTAGETPHHYYESWDRALQNPGTV